ncbi:MAG: ECF transporter S component [candidate division KSB1 bacterium]|nr:ECF transporter S component [candidate division KSB1 bacterium]
MKTRILAAVALWIAGTVALGHLLATLPNVELVTASVFLGGVVFGPAFGALIGLTGEFLYSLTSPFGLATPPLLAAQLLGMALAGLAGGLVGPRFFSRPRPLIVHLLTAAVGLGLTVLYDLLTTSSFLILSGLSLSRLVASLFFGLGFYATHLAWNTFVFATLVPPLGRKLPGFLPWTQR